MNQRNVAEKPSSAGGLVSDLRWLVREASEWRIGVLSPDAIYKATFVLTSVAVATVLSATVAGLTGTTTLTFYIAAVVATALYAGPKAALSTLVISIPVAIYFVISDGHSFVVPESSDAVRLTSYVTVSLPIVALAHMRRRFDEKYRRVQQQLTLARAELRRLQECDVTSPSVVTAVEGGRINSPDGLEVDLGKRTALRDGSPISLTRTEWSLLEHLAVNAGAVLTIAELERHAFGNERGDRAQHLRNCMLRLRRKVEVDPSNPKAITTVHGIGYRLSTQPGAREADGKRDLKVLTAVN
jgi:DNA-binding winged helix-turn-helix (wHTH) protein